jgi:hypothetical protein
MLNIFNLNYIASLGKSKTLNSVDDILTKYNTMKLESSLDKDKGKHSCLTYAEFLRRRLKLVTIQDLNKTEFLDSVVQDYEQSLTKEFYLEKKYLIKGSDSLESIDIDDCSDYIDYVNKKLRLKLSLIDLLKFLLRDAKSIYLYRKTCTSYIHVEYALEIIDEPLIDFIEKGKADLKLHYDGIKIDDIDREAIQCIFFYCIELYYTSKNEKVPVNCGLLAFQMMPNLKIDLSLKSDLYTELLTDMVRKEVCLDFNFEKENKEKKEKFEREVIYYCPVREVVEDYPEEISVIEEQNNLKGEIQNCINITQDMEEEAILIKAYQLVHGTFKLKWLTPYYNNRWADLLKQKFLSRVYNYYYIGAGVYYFVKSDHGIQFKDVNQLYSVLKSLSFFFYNYETQYQDVIARDGLEYDIIDRLCDFVCMQSRLLNSIDLCKKIYKKNLRLWLSHTGISVSEHEQKVVMLEEDENYSRDKDDTQERDIQEVV